ncbi:MAG: ArsR/SmtB family transcription factor [Eubacteriaceae bacterium]
MKITEVFKILSDNNRVRIINLLCNGELCVCEFEHILGISQSNLSKHLRLMVEMGFLKNRREYKFVFYRMNEDLTKEHPFLKMVFEEEFKKDDFLSDERNRLLSYKNSELTCQTINFLNK